MSTISLNAPMAVLPARPARVPVRLTRRGRLVLFAVALVAALALLVAVGPISTATNDDVPQRTTQVVTLHAGDTLWGLAHGLTGGSGTDAMISQIMEMNNLDSALVHPGQKLRIPLV